MLLPTLRGSECHAHAHPTLTYARSDDSRADTHTYAIFATHALPHILLHTLSCSEYRPHTYTTTFRDGIYFIHPVASLLIFLHHQCIPSPIFEPCRCVTTNTA
eukprot:GDKI01026375.1.p2 GENE.GDKI01026375.1~~GDKI01026375.1.p2  ORF type:complete len:103 (+),score=6.93 GDKI01026375.1:206-514(+)